jgi:hypothetical protein
VQGSSSSPFRSREFYRFLRYYATKSHQSIETDYIQTYEKNKKHVLRTYPNWDKYLLNLFHCLLLEFDKIRDQDAQYSELIEFIKDLSSRDDGQCGKVYENNIRKIIGEVIEQEIVITNIHKVKGIEYDAVIIPPSFANLPLSLGRDNSISEKQLQEEIEEERRLQYVAYTRAKYRLIVIKHKRELAMDKGEEFEFSDEITGKLGVKIKEGIDKLDISWAAQHSSFVNSQKVFEHIRDNLKLGSPVELRRSVIGEYTFWEVFCNNEKCGQLNMRFFPNTEKDILKGFMLSSIERYTFDETLKYDENKKKNYVDFGFNKSRNTNSSGFSSKWSDLARKRGYIYLVDFAGFGN